MSKKRKKKLSRKARKGQPHAQATPAAAPAAPPAQPTRPAQPEQPATPAEPQPPAAGAPAHHRQPVVATFRPAQEPAAAPAHAGSSTAGMEVEYASVRKDLRKLGLTIVTFIVVIAGLVVVNDQTGFIGTLGEQLFRLWE